MNPILITGSSGLIGSALRRAFTARGQSTRGLDLRGEGVERGDVRDRERVNNAVAGCSGIVHLAAVSRAIDGEKDPDNCRSTNMGGVRHVIEAAAASHLRPWLVFASSREVYGEAATLPVTEDAPFAALNIYGHTKVAGEQMMDDARARGARTAILRLSNVYGSPSDHGDRVVPAFARGAMDGGELRVDGADHLFDFTYLPDAIEGILAAIDRIDSQLPPVHLLTGRGTTLGELAALAIELAGRGTVVPGPPRTFDVARFVGDPTRATQVLGWTATTPVREGLRRMIEAMTGK
jgi:nucleoside-diphosphate-sugar epimerase